MRDPYSVKKLLLSQANQCSNLRNAPCSARPCQGEWPHRQQGPVPQPTTMNQKCVIQNSFKGQAVSIAAAPEVRMPATACLVGATRLGQKKKTTTNIRVMSKQLNESEPDALAWSTICMHKQPPYVVNNHRRPRAANSVREALSLQ